MKFMVEKPQFNTLELKPGTALYIEGPGKFYRGRNSIVKRCTPLELYVIVVNEQSAIDTCRIDIDDMKSYKFTKLTKEDK